MCLGAIYWARPARIFFAAGRYDAADAGFDDHFIYKEIGTELNERKIPTNQILRNEAIEVFKVWKESDIKIPY
jgi:tRNA(Arg) A34 adenosine deaminase TadA